MASVSTWTCAACTLSNGDHLVKCDACGSDRPPPTAAAPPSPRGEPEGKADVEPDHSGFAQDLHRLAHPPTPEELQMEVVRLTSALDSARAAVADREARVQQLKGVVYNLRDLLWKERDERQAAVDRLWHDMSWLMGQVELAALLAADATTTTTATTPTGAGVGAAAATAGTPAPPSSLPGPAPLHRSESEAEVMATLKAKVQAFQTLCQWKARTKEAEDQRKNFILTHSWAWKERAKAAARQLADRKAADGSVREYLLSQKAAGIPLTIGQENFLKVKDHVEGKTYECPVCFDDEFTLDDVVIMDDCLHVFCVGCLRGHLLTNIKDGHSRHITCPEHGCDRKLDADEVKLALGGEHRTEYSRYIELMLQDHLESDDSMVRCPKPRCQTPMIAEGSTTMVVCPAPACRFSFCAKCKVEWHSDSTCEQYQQWLKENADADNLYEEWARMNTKACPKSEGGCGRPIQKNGGCNHMTCTKCRFSFCWLCLKKYRSGHFSRGSGTPCAGKQFT